MATKWIKYRGEFHNLENFRISRRILCDNPQKIDLHGICDASNHAYGVCICMVSYANNGDIYFSLVCAQSKVAPLKPTTIPRLELCGALLLSRVMKHCLAVINFKPNQIFI